MATGEPAYNPSIGGSNPTPPVTIDGTGLTTTVPLLVKNGKSQSGVEVQVTGTLSSGFELNDSTGTLKGAIGLAGASAGWVSDSAVSDVVIGAATSSRIRFGTFGGATVLNVDCTNNIVTLNSGNKLAIDANTSLTTCALQFRGDANTGIAQPGGADSITLVAGGIRAVEVGTTFMSFATGYNWAFDGTTGSKIGTSTTGKIGFWNATPVIQPALTGVTTAGFTANASANALFAESTYTGNTGATAYTVSDIVKNLKTAGILAS